MIRFAMQSGSYSRNAGILASKAIASKTESPKLCAFASPADVAKGGDGAKSALREILFCLLPNQLANAFGSHQLKDVRSGEAKEIAFGSQLERAHCDPVLYPAAKISF
jgi:hypothetical protein